ncbi:PQQ-dependent sugar dehydrogenase [Ornithinicoccus halotolerans]|uniref:PQQ-dependent sugar dehydrogenase n=1 Tax=Ornithinicoccus halotolerans TaxID=1748220 RepID=UPI001E4997B9|nr:PQQ-dependent sugar dehydrogenase [Ornithinicoccus halotolerans]
MAATRVWLPAAALLVVAGCSPGDTDGADQPAEVGQHDRTTAPEDVATSPTEDPATAPTEDAVAVPTEEPPPPLQPVTAMASGLEVPWGLVVGEDGSALVGERDSARVWRVSPAGEREPVTTVPGVAADGEGGLLGLAVDPGDGPGAESFYAYATTAGDNRVLRVTPDLVDPEAEPEVETLLEGIPRAGNHNGGRLAFGPDGFLYVTTGDASAGELAQDPGSLGGKILRITPEGEPAPGNPEPGSPVWSLGHRNVQGLGWDAAGRLWASEFGANAWDEVNLIEPGSNYGWPIVEGTGGEPDFVDPVVTWPTSEASPSGLAVGPDGDLYVAALRGESLWRVPLDGVHVGEPERLLAGDYGRLRSVVTGPRETLWVLTSNTFRGDPAEDDDRLLRLADW